MSRGPVMDGAAGLARVMDMLRGPFADDTPRTIWGELPEDRRMFWLWNAGVAMEYRRTPWERLPADVRQKLSADLTSKVNFFCFIGAAPRLSPKAAA